MHVHVHVCVHVNVHVMCVHLIQNDLFIEHGVYSEYSTVTSSHDPILIFMLYIHHVVTWSLTHII